MGIFATQESDNQYLTDCNLLV